MDLSSDNIVDDAGTYQNGARDILQAFCDNGFSGDVDKAGLALGRPAGELNEMLDGDAEVDDDLVMKARGIANERGFEIS